MVTDGHSGAIWNDEPDARVWASAEAQAQFLVNLQVNTQSAYQRFISATERLIDALRAHADVLADSDYAYVFEIPSGNTERWTPPALPGSWRVAGVTYWARLDNASRFNVSIAGLVSTPLSLAFNAGNVNAVPLDIPISLPAFISVAVSNAPAGEVAVIVLRLSRIR